MKRLKFLKIQWIDSEHVEYGFSITAFLLMKLLLYNKSSADK